MDPLGSGSDYTAFLDHLGVPAVDVGFSGRYGVYHSVYDNFTWMEKVGDPEFLTHAMAARLYTVLAMRAAAAEVVPLTFVPYGEALRDARRRPPADGRAQGPRRRARAEPSPPIGVRGPGRPGRGRSAASRPRPTALDRATDDARRAATTCRASSWPRVNDALTRVERAFLLPDGLPGRPWFKHAIYAPGLTTGYASWPLPGSARRSSTTTPTMLAAQVPALVARIDAAASAMRAAQRAIGDPLAADNR